MIRKMMKQFSEIPKHAFVENVEVETYPPYADVVEDGEKLTSNSVQYEIPVALAYYLRKHWRGTEELQRVLRREFQEEVKTVLGLKECLLDVKKKTSGHIEIHKRDC